MPRERILPHIILGIMSSNGGEMLGKDIITFFNREIGEFWQVAHSQVYPELKRMTTEGYLTCHGLPDNDKEKMYRLTAHGQEKLDEWLVIPNQETPKQRDIFSLKMFSSNRWTTSGFRGCCRGRLIFWNRIWRIWKAEKRPCLQIRQLLKIIMAII